MFEFITGLPLDGERIHEIGRLFRERLGSEELALASGLRNVVHARAFFALFSVWPPYIRDDFAQTLLATATMLRFPELQFLIFIDRRVAGYVSTLPVYVDPTCEQLPDEGYTWAIKSAIVPWRRRPNALCALAAVLDPNLRGRGLSEPTIETLKTVARARGMTRLIAPVRPTEKQRHPEQDMQDYIQRLTVGNLPEDPWLRSHVLGGGVVRNVCRRSIVIRASKTRWQHWLKNDVHAGANLVAGGLAPMHFDPKTGIGVYTEPNVWVDYDLRPRPTHPLNSDGVRAWQ